MRTPWPEIGSRIPLALLTPPPDLWRSLWPSDAAMVAAIHAERARDNGEAARVAARAGLLRELRRVLRTRRYSRGSEAAYSAWTARFLASLDRDLDPLRASWRDAAAFLGRLATEQRLVASTQNQALAALRLLFRDVLRRDAEEVERIPRARMPSPLPQVLTRAEVASLIDQFHDAFRLMISLLYGCGLRLMECCRLRVRDLDFGAGQIVVREGKGARDRIVPLPDRLRAPLAVHVSRLRAQHREALRAGHGAVDLPHSVERLSPAARFDPGWQWLFPARRLHLDLSSGERRRRHVDPSGLQRAFQQALRASTVARPATCHTLRHCYATHLVEGGCDIRTVQELLGHRQLSTTMVYLHGPARRDHTGGEIRSPLDSIPDEAG